MNDIKSGTLFALHPRVKRGMYPEHIYILDKRGENSYNVIEIWDGRDNRKSRYGVSTIEGVYVMVDDER